MLNSFFRLENREKYPWKGMFIFTNTKINVNYFLSFSNSELKKIESKAKPRLKLILHW